MPRRLVYKLLNYTLASAAIALNKTPMDRFRVFNNVIIDPHSISIYPNINVATYIVW
jgi:hypothetical protein